MVLQPDGFGIEVLYGGPARPDVIESVPTAILEGTEFDLSFTGTFTGETNNIEVTVFLDDGGAGFGLEQDGSWSNAFANFPPSYTGSTINNPTPPPTFIPDPNAGSQIFTTRSQPTPATGDIIVTITAPLTDFAPDVPSITTGSVIVDDCSVRVVKQGQNDLQGEFHTGQRSDRPSSIIKNVLEAFNGDNAVDLYIGTIYQSDEITPTETWFREGFVETKEILRIAVEETLRMSAQPAQLFSGDIYGYIPYLSVINIDNITGLFMSRSYSYDTKNNIISLENREIFGGELDDIEYTKTFDYGNVVEPTIIG